MAVKVPEPAAQRAFVERAAGVTRDKIAPRAEVATM
jgi:hypothetical protein